jgi:hypothetical protein
MSEFTRYVIRDISAEMLASVVGFLKVTIDVVNMQGYWIS